MTRSQQSLLRAHGIKPVKRRGQNFLVDGNLSRAIAQDVLAVSGRVLELGAGGGALTTHLLEQAERVVCVEVDRNLCELLRSEFQDRENFHLIETDLAVMDWSAAAAAAGDGAVVAGNLPYVLTSKVLFALPEIREEISGGVFMVQKEFAQRLTAQPGGKDYGVLAVLLGALFEMTSLRRVPASVFWPRPAVASAVVRLAPRPQSETDWAEIEYADFSSTVKRVFQQRRKKLGTVLRAGFHLDADQVARIAEAAGVDPGARPEEIGIGGYRALSRLLHEKGRG